MTAVNALPKCKRHPSDYREDDEHVEIARILSELPERHPARIAYCSGAWDGANTLSLGRLVSDRIDLVDRLVAVYSTCRPRSSLSSREPVTGLPGD